IGLHAGVARRMAKSIDPRRHIEAAQKRGKLWSVLPTKARNMRLRGADRGPPRAAAQLDDRCTSAHCAGRLGVDRLHGYALQAPRGAAARRRRCQSEDSPAGSRKAVPKKFGKIPDLGSNGAMATTHTLGPFRLDADAEILFRGSEPLPVG